MPTRNINLTEQLDGFVTDKVESGKYANASEVVRAGLRALQEDEAEDQARLEYLRSALAEADAEPESEWVDGDVAFAQARAYLEDLIQLEAKYEKAEHGKL
jgi:antitoxin ParD1/3/4